MQILQAIITRPSNPSLKLSIVRPISNLTDGLLKDEENVVEFGGQIGSLSRSHYRELAWQRRNSTGKVEGAGWKTKAENHANESAAVITPVLPEPVVSDEYSGVISFEYVPTGKILLTQEAREHIIDFFQ